METAYDWITVSIFAALVTLFLSRSVSEARDNDRPWHYLVPSVGCALTNWLGNEGWHLPAMVVLAGTLFSIRHHLFRTPPPTT